MSTKQDGDSEAASPNGKEAAWSTSVAAKIASSTKSANSSPSTHSSKKPTKPLELRLRNGARRIDALEGTGHLPRDVCDEIRQAFGITDD